MFIKRLINFGLTENEAKVYLTALGMGPVLASTLARISGINRASIYAVLECLTKRNLMNIYNKNGFSYFIATDPEVLIKIGEKKIYEEKFKINNIMEILPELQFMNRNNHLLKPRMKLGEGISGIKMIYNSLLKAGKDFFSFWNIKLMPKEIKHFLKTDFLPEFSKRNLILHLFVPEKVVCDDFLLMEGAKNRIEISVTENTFCESSIDLTENRVAFMSYQKNINLCNGFFIEDETVYGSMRNLFEKMFKK